MPSRKHRRKAGDLAWTQRRPRSVSRLDGESAATIDPEEEEAHRGPPSEDVDY
jgi:hypothetical protein